MMYKRFDLIRETSDTEKTRYTFICLEDMRVKLTDIAQMSRPSRRHRIWFEKVWRSNGHKDFTPTHVPPDVVSEAMEHFKKSIHWVAPEF
jgi:hypothetical protein